MKNDNLPNILIVDDQLGADMDEKLIFLNHNKYLVEWGEEVSSNTFAHVVFCSGQKTIDNRIINDYEVVREIIASNPPNAKKWDLILLDGRFDSGCLENGFLRFGSGDSDDGKFGQKIREKIEIEFPELKILMVSSESQKPPHVPKQELTKEILSNFLNQNS